MWIGAETDKKEVKKSAAEDLDYINLSYRNCSPKSTVMVSQDG